MEIKDIVQKAHDNAVKHGFWDPPLPFGTAIALIHSELSEAPGRGTRRKPNQTWGPRSYDLLQRRRVCRHRADEMLCKTRRCGGELADAVIRIADLCGHLGIDLDAVIAEKMAYNAGRPYKHGKRF